MKSIHKFVYATALFLSALNFAPSLASAQNAAGTFTLTHEVHWQNAIVPAGEYRFTMAADGPSELLTLSKISGKRTGFMLLVTEVEGSEPSDLSRLVVVPRASGSFVSAMQLPEIGVTLRFAVPTETREVASITNSTATSTPTQTASATR